jgi:hypothetical protein
MTADETLGYLQSETRNELGYLFEMSRELAIMALGSFRPSERVVMRELDIITDGKSGQLELTAHGYDVAFLARQLHQPGS